MSEKPKIKIILLNGPKSSGKDSVAKILQNLLLKEGCAVVLEKFSGPMKRSLAALFDLNDQEYDYYFETEEGKGVIDGKFFGLTSRDSLIAISEKFAKLIFGKHIFAELFVRRALKVIESITSRDDSSSISKNPDTIYFIISDSGFKVEVDWLCDPNCKLYDAQKYLFRLHRIKDGLKFSFDGDSREWVYTKPSNYTNGEGTDFHSVEGAEGLRKAVQKHILEEIL